MGFLTYPVRGPHCPIRASVERLVGVLLQGAHNRAHAAHEQHRERDEGAGLPREGQRRHDGARQQDSREARAHRRPEWHIEQVRNDGPSPRARSRRRNLNSSLSIS